MRTNEIFWHEERAYKKWMPLEYVNSIFSRHFFVSLLLFIFLIIFGLYFIVANVYLHNYITLIGYKNKLGYL